jgi:hypothetical protein
MAVRLSALRAGRPLAPGRFVVLISVSDWDQKKNCHNLYLFLLIGALYKTIILSVVLYGCETWSLILREDNRPSVFENRVLRRIFGPKGDEMTWDWRKLHNEELHNSYSSPSIIRMIKSRRMRWVGHVARMRKANAYRMWETQKERDHWEDQDVGGWTISKWMLEG